MKDLQVVVGIRVGEAFPFQAVVDFWKQLEPSGSYFNPGIKVLWVELKELQLPGLSQNCCYHLLLPSCFFDFPAYSQSLRYGSSLIIM